MPVFPDQVDRRVCRLSRSRRRSWSQRWIDSHRDFQRTQLSLLKLVSSTSGRGPDVRARWGVLPTLTRASKVVVAVRPLHRRLSAGA
jgi:hypothetical protein